MAIKITESKGALHVKIDGEEFDLLARIARAMNRCAAWCDDDNSPLTVFRNFSFIEVAREELTTPGMLADAILDGIGTDTETGGKAPEPLHGQRIAELRAAFEAEGLLEKGGEA